MRWIIENYEALRRVKIELPPGTITAIVGPNGQGKSCVVRAIDGFIRNQSGKDFIRANTTGCLVKFIEDLGLSRVKTDISWKTYTKKSTVYTVNGRRHTAIGRKPLHEIDSEAPFFVEDSGTIPIITHEKTRAFPFNLSPVTSYAVFNRFLGAPQIEKIVSNLKFLVKRDNTHLTNVEGRIDAFDSEIVALKNEMKKLPDIDKLRFHVRQLSTARLRYDKAFKVFEVVVQLESDRVRYAEQLGLSKFIFDSVGPKVVAVKERLDMLVEMIDVREKVDLMRAQIDKDAVKLRVNSAIADIDLEPIRLKLERLNSYIEIKDMAIQAERLRDALKKWTANFNMADEELKSFNGCPLCGREF